MKTILELSNTEAKEFLLKSENYCEFELPSYFNFNKIISVVEKKLNNHNLSDYYSDSKPYDHEGVNYKLLNNKDGKFAWRPLQIIHPALFVSLVNIITENQNWGVIKERFKKFRRNDKIECFSLPVRSDSIQSDKAESISIWVEKVEKRSVELSLDFRHILDTDISDCYGSIYTHSISWALHGKDNAKKEKENNNLIGNKIDNQLRSMSYGQTNGIPQGSKIMDFIAEIVLGYADMLLTDKLSKLTVKDYHILRYRDDYRIFVNNPNDADLILKNLTEVLISLGLRINSSKCKFSNDIIESSYKPDKYFFKCNTYISKSLEDQILYIYNISKKYPNSGTVSKLLDSYFKSIKNVRSTKENLLVIISVLTEVIYNNPRTYPIGSAVLSKLIDLLPETCAKSDVLLKIFTKFKNIANIGYLEIWLQRVSLKIDNKLDFNEGLCRKINDNEISIWNSEWLNSSIKKIINSTSIIDSKMLNEMKPVIQVEEVELFKRRESYWYNS